MSSMRSRFRGDHPSSDFARLATERLFTASAIDAICTPHISQASSKHTLRISHPKTDATASAITLKFASPSWGFDSDNPCSRGIHEAAVRSTAALNQHRNDRVPIATGTRQNCKVKLTRNLRHQALKANYVPAFDGDTPRGRYTYMSHPDQVGSYFEISEASAARQAMQATVRNGAIDWDGTDPVREMPAT